MSVLDEIDKLQYNRDNIPLSDVRRWMQSDDIGVMGAVADIVTYQRPWERISPPMEEQELELFLKRYYGRCIAEDPDDERASNRYFAMMEILGWFTAVPNDEDVMSQTMLLHLRDWLADIYVQGAEEIRTAIVNGFLEHVLEEPRWRGVFEDWRTHPVLSEAHEDAMKWALAHERVV